MNVFLRIDINIVAMILLGVVLLIAYKRLDRKDVLNRLFLCTSGIIIFEILVETLTCIINGRSGQWLNTLSVILHVCLFITGPVLTYFWYFFIYKWVVPDTAITKKSLVIFLIPVMINLILTVLSPFYSLVFRIDSLNIYHRGSLFIVSAAITYFYLLHVLIVILRQRKKIVWQEFITLFIFGILPAVGGLIQSLFYGVLLMWSSAAFSLVIVYNFLQQRMVHLDNLTGVWDRGSFYFHISQRVRRKNDDKFGAVFFDIDGLKQINDEYGHFEGDSAIKTAIQLIKSSLRKTDIVARMGGDEFCILLDCESEEELLKTIERINASFDHYNNESRKHYKLECSFGADIYNGEYENIEQFLQHVDNLMYNNKKTKKQFIL